jgi:hypothetical protein
MLLRDSEVARAVRSYLLNVEEYASTETRQVAAEIEHGSLAWFDELLSRGTVEFFANGNPKRVDPDYMPFIQETVVPDEAAFTRAVGVASRAIGDAQADAVRVVNAARDDGFKAVSGFYSALGRQHNPPLTVPDPNFKEPEQFTTSNMYKSKGD